MRKLFVAASAALLLSAPSTAQTVYTYDALGRLVQAKEVSDPTKIVKYTYDAADNRTKVKNGNAAPTAVFDHLSVMTSGSTWTGVLFVLANDTDADLPDDTLRVISTSGDSHASVPGGDADGISFSAPPGWYSFDYTMRDANGATSSSSVFIQVVYCNPICEIDP